MGRARTSRSSVASHFVDLALETEYTRKQKACSVVCYSEATLLRIPFSGVYAPKEPGVTSVTLDPEDASVPGQSTRWTVRSKGLSLPGTFARQIFRALEWIALDESIVLRKPFSNSFLASPREVCERLCWHPDQARVAAIESAFEALAGIELVPSPASQTAPSRSTSQPLRLLRILSSGFVRGNGGRMGFSHYTFSFDGRIAQSIQRGQVVALNWALWTGLQDPVAQRLLEVLESESARHPEAPEITLARPSLQRLIPMSPAASSLDRQRLLDKAHRDLIAAEYLTGVGSSASASPQMLIYQPGIAWHSLRLRARQKPVVNPYRQSQQEMLRPGLRTSARALLG